MNQKIYRLIKGERFKSGVIQHQVLMFGEERIFRYQSIRIGLIWPSTEHPAFFVAGGMEIEDKYSPSSHGVIRVIEQSEIEDLSLDTLFNDLTDSYTLMKCDSIYVDKGEGKKDFCNHLYDYLDKKNLRSLNVYDVPYKDIVSRFSTIKVFNDSGCLIVDKGSLLFQDLQGISRAHLKDNPEEHFYRLNGLGFLIASFAKFPPTKSFDFKSFEKGGKSGDWMAY